jgi:hypothetical protein
MPPHVVVAVPGLMVVVQVVAVAPVAQAVAITATTPLLQMDRTSPATKSTSSRGTLPADAGIASTKTSCPTTVWLLLHHPPCMGADPNWYLDSGATDHITGDLDKLTMNKRYIGNEQIQAANDAGMDIIHIGNSALPSSSRPLQFNQVLYVPNTHNEGPEKVTRGG